VTALEKYLTSVTARAAAATPGPWENAEPDHEYTVRQVEALRDGHEGIVASGIYPKADAEFIAAARADVDRLVAMVEYLTKQIRVMQAMAGHPSAADACRNIIAQGSFAVSELDRIAGEAAP
jgi:hypothetical protein